MMPQTEDQEKCVLRKVNSLHYYAQTFRMALAMAILCLWPPAHTAGMKSGRALSCSMCLHGQTGITAVFSLYTPTARSSPGITLLSLLK